MSIDVALLKMLINHVELCEGVLVQGKDVQNVTEV